MKISLAKVGAAALLAGAAFNVSAETLVLRELSIRTFSGTWNDEKDHPVLVVDDVNNPKPIGPGRGAGGYAFLNNKLLDFASGKELGWLRGKCVTIDHGPKGPWTGPVTIGAGGPFESDCQFVYLLEGGQMVANGNVDLNAMEKDVPLLVAITGGTGKYRGARGQVTIQQDPPGQPITYKVTLDYDLPTPAPAAQQPKKK